MKQTYVLHFVQEQLSLEVEEGTTVMNALKAANIFLDAPCGGKGTCHKCLVQISSDSASWKTVKACQTKISSSLYIDTAKSKRKHRILTEAAARSVPYLPSAKISEELPCYLAAFDIGTTTIASYLLDGHTGKQLGTASCVNPQAAYGADVISRADYTMHHGFDDLTGCVRKAINDLLQELAHAASIQVEEILQICLVGNTCMHHIFFQYPMNSLVLAPYVPYQKGLTKGKAADFQIHIHPEGELIFLPVIAGFVGADTMGCLLAVRPDLKEEITLMIDIGTNGELVLGNRERLVCCSTAAGPAFEGAKIECGMRGAQGAIDHVFWDKEGFRFSVIGDGKPRGICGSGLIDAIACLRKQGLIDETGHMLSCQEAAEVCGAEIAAHMIQKENMTAFLFDPQAPQVYLTQKDVREVQLAKGAISAGILLLEKHLGITHEDIQTIYIAGAFGNYMNPENACNIGLLPAALKTRIQSIGNAAGEGAKIALLNKEELAETVRLSQQVDFLELAAIPEFQDCFVDELEF